MADNPIRSALVNGAVIAGTFVVGFAFLEVGLRVVNGVPAAPWSDWRTAYAVETNAATANRYDETLGWVLRENLKSNHLNTIEYGIRRNGPDTVLAEGAVLASGDSFTAGSEVLDHESWPAHLEQLIGEPVMNAGVGAYGTDQIVLRAEQLIDPLKPHTIVLSFFDQDILRSGYSRYGENKPYFVDSPTGIELKNVPVPDSTQNTAPQRATGLGHNLYLPAVVMSAIGGTPLYTPTGSTYRKIANDPVAVSCALLQRMKQRTYEQGIHLVLVLQYGGQIHHLSAPRPGHADLVIDCAESLAIPVVDEFDSIRGIAQESSSSLQELYVMGAGEFNFGHMSSKGNALVARLISAALADLPEKPMPPPVDVMFGPSPFTTPLGDVLATSDHALDLSAFENNLIDVSHLWWGQDGFTLSSDGPTGEHYLTIPIQKSLPAGRYELSLQMRAGSSSRARLQLLHSEVVGVLADIDLSNEQADLTRLGPVQRIGASVEASLRDEEWKEVRFYAQFPEGNVRILLQLLDSEGSSLLPGNGTDIDVANLKLDGFIGDDRTPPIAERN
ncbi:SGNH/GDSL hydrolase family protein [Pyruvatibacter sp.]